MSEINPTDEAGDEWREACVIEELEARELLSAAPHPAAAHAHKAKPAAAAPAVHVAAAKQPAKAAAHAAGDYTGTWAGTFQTEPATGDKPLSVTFTKQKGLAVSGTFDLGAMAGASVVSTATVTHDRHFLAMIKTPGGRVSFSGQVASNEQYIFGRWCFNGSRGFQTGTFIMTRE